MGCYRIVRWAERFENNRTKELKKMSWVPMPNQLDDDGYTELVEHPNGAAHYGAWCAVVHVASKCSTRGILVRDNGQPHTTASLARITRLPEALFIEVIARLLAIGWLEEAEIPQQPAVIPQPGVVIPQDSAAGSQAKAAIPRSDAAADDETMAADAGPGPERGGPINEPYRLTFEPPADPVRRERFRTFWSRCKAGYLQDLIFQKGREELHVVCRSTNGNGH